jgi:hypothetical protein
MGIPDHHREKRGNLYLRTYRYSELITLASFIAGPPRLDISLAVVQMEKNQGTNSMTGGENWEAW